MTVKEMKEVLELMDDNAEVGICVNEPAGWMCPDGCVVGVDSVCMGIDWHQGEVLVVPKHKLDIHDASEWMRNATPKDEEPKTEPNGKKEPRINGLTIPEYIRTMERAHEATKNSTLVFK